MAVVTIPTGTESADANMNDPMLTGHEAAVADIIIESGTKPSGNGIEQSNGQKKNPKQLTMASFAFGTKEALELSPTKERFRSVLLWDRAGLKIDCEKISSQQTSAVALGLRLRQHLTWTASKRRLSYRRRHPK